jgi:hypothetical protein
MASFLLGSTAVLLTSAVSFGVAYAVADASNASDEKKWMIAGTTSLGGGVAVATFIMAYNYTIRNLRYRKMLELYYAPREEIEPPEFEMVNPINRRGVSWPSDRSLEQTRYISARDLHIEGDRFGGRKATYDVPDSNDY